MRTDKRDHHLNDGNHQSEDEGEVTEFCNHGLSIGRSEMAANRNRRVLTPQ